MPWNTPRQKFCLSPYYLICFFKLNINLLITGISFNAVKTVPNISYNGYVVTVADNKIPLGQFNAQFCYSEKVAFARKVRLCAFSNPAFCVNNRFAFFFVIQNKNRMLFILVALFYPLRKIRIADLEILFFKAFR